MLQNAPDRSTTNGIELWLKGQIDHYEKLIEDEGARHQRETIDVKEWLFWALTGLTVAIIFSIGGSIWWLAPTITMIGPIPINPQILLFPLLALYIVVSFRSVDVDEVAGADFFGTPVYQFERGLKWVPFLIFHFRKDKATFVQSEFPGDADRIDWRDEKEPLEKGKVRPIFALTGENPSGTLATDKQMNIGMSALAKFQLVRDRFFDFIIHVGPINDAKREEILLTMTGGDNVSDYMLEVVRHLRDTSTAILREIIGQLSYAEVTSHLHLVNTLYWKRLQNTVAAWGIEVNEVRITNINPGHEFNATIQKRGSAIAVRDAKIVEAEGEKQKRVLEGQGTAAAEQALLEARAKGYAEIAKIANNEAGQIAISADTAGKLAAAGNTIVVGTDGVRDLIGLVAATKKGAK